MPSTLHVTRKPELQDSLDLASHRISACHRQPFRSGAARPGHCCISSWDTTSRSGEDKVRLHDFHATILKLMELDHPSLSVNHNVLEMRLTDLHVYHDIYNRLVG